VQQGREPEMPGSRELAWRTPKRCSPRVDPVQQLDQPEQDDEAKRILAASGSWRARSELVSPGRDMNCIEDKILRHPYAYNALIEYAS